MRTGVIGGTLGYQLLHHLGRRVARGVDPCDGSAYRHRSKVEALFGRRIWTALAGRVVIDFGCGEGAEAVEIARRGARRVIGIDVRPHALARAVDGPPVDRRVRPREVHPLEHAAVRGLRAEPEKLRAQLASRPQEA